VDGLGIWDEFSEGVFMRIGAEIAKTLREFGRLVDPTEKTTADPTKRQLEK
jgi:hypothetical protein